MSFLNRHAPSRQEVREAFSNGTPLENTNGRADRARAARAERRQREHEQTLGHRRAGRAR